jgi:hypothetical protein
MVKPINRAAKTPNRGMRRDKRREGGNGSGPTWN